MTKLELEFKINTTSAHPAAQVVIKGYPMDDDNHPALTLQHGTFADLEIELQDITAQIDNIRKLAKYRFIHDSVPFNHRRDIE